MMLLTLIEKHGGPKACTRQTRLIHKLAGEYPELFGVTGSIRRSRTKYLVDRWKRDHDFGTTRSNLVACFENENRGSLQCPLEETEVEDNVATEETIEEKKPKAKLKPKPDKVPSATTRSSTNRPTKRQPKAQPDKPMSSNLASPLKLLRAAGTQKGPSSDKTFLEQATGNDGWLTKLKSIEDRFDAAKLHTSLTSLVTKMKKKNRLKTTHISLNSIGVEVSNEFFSPGCPEGKLKMLPLPYKVTGRNGETSTKITVVWRAFIVGTLDDVDEDVEQQKGDEDLLNELLAQG
eukprot:Sro262_g102080.2  (291) ;mRNA; f:70007-71167